MTEKINGRPEEYLPELPVSVLDSFPPVDEALPDALLAEEIRTDPAKLVVLDDDPTGVQTVHDISVFTGWDADSIRQGFAEEQSVFYILTNSRGMTVDEAILNVDQYLDSALLAGMGEVSIIHGKGTGALRSAVQQELRHHPHVKSFRLGVYGEGEDGVTVVTLK